MEPQIKEKLTQPSDFNTMQDICWGDYRKYLADSKTEPNYKEIIENALETVQTENNTSLPSDKKVIMSTLHDILSGFNLDHINWALEKSWFDWNGHVERLNNCADRIGNIACNARGLDEYKCLLYLKLIEFRNALQNSLESDTFELPQVCWSSDSYAIDLANQHLDQEKIFRILEQLSQGVFSYQLLVMLLRKMPHRFLQHCSNMMSKLRPGQKYSHCICFFLNLLLYCHVGGMDYYDSITAIQKAINIVVLENNEATLMVSEIPDDSKEIRAAAGKLTGLTLAENVEQSVEQESNSENESDSSSAQSNKSKLLLKCAMGFGATVVLWSLGIPHLVPAASIAISKAF